MYYRRKSHTLRWTIIIIILIILGGLTFWFYKNYFSKIEINPQETIENKDAGILAKILLVNLAQTQGDVQINVEGKGYEKAIGSAILHQGDKIKTGENGIAILNLENSSSLRLGTNTEIILENLDEQNVIINQLKGRVFQSLTDSGKYQIKTLKAVIYSLGTKFEVITDDNLKSVAILVFENKVRAEIFDDNKELLVASRLDTGEKALIDLTASKNNILKIQNFNIKDLETDPWYKLNFNLNKGIESNLAAAAPQIEITSESLALSASPKENGIYLSWSVYNQDNFKSYKILRSDKNIDLKYPENGEIKSSDVKDFNSYLDTLAENGKRYYYRICVVKTDNNVVCGNMSSAEIASAEQDTTPPASPALSSTISESGVNLTWTPNTEEDFKEYRIVRSITNPYPVYPKDGFIALKLKGFESYLDREVNITSAGYNYYRICSLDQVGNISCSNTIIVENGQIK